MAYLMGIDLGTSSVKTIIIDEQGKLMAISCRSYSIKVPTKGQAEQSPDIWWKACSQTIQDCIENSSIKAKDIDGIGLSGQMHGTVIVDEKNHPIRPAIIHNDQRADKETKEIIEILGEDYINENIMNPVFSGSQLVSLYWIKKFEPKHFAKIYKVLLPKDYIRLKLTGEIATDYTDASGTLAFNLQKRDWNRDVLEKLAITQDIFPKCFAPYEITGYISLEAAESTGLKVGTPVVGGGGDQIMQAIGNGVVAPGTATVTIGTSGQVFFPVHAPVVNKALNTHLFCGALPDSWFIMGAMLNAGLCLNWFTNKVFPNDRVSFHDIDEKLKMFGQASGGVVFLPYLTGERTPHMNPYAQGMFWGLTLNTDYRHLYYAIMEGVAFGLKECFDLCEELSYKPAKLIASGGGSKSSLWIQILADVFDREIYTTNVEEHACVGAAIVAGVGTGVYATIRDGCLAVVKMSASPAIPIRENVLKYYKTINLFKQIYAANASLFVENIKR